VVEPLAEHEEALAVALLAAGGRAPLRLDLGQMTLAADVLVDRDAGVDVGGGAEAGGVTLEDPSAQRLDALRQLDPPAGLGERPQRVVERFRRTPR
jgi:hypothetical protein